MPYVVAVCVAGALACLAVFATTVARSADARRPGSPLVMCSGETFRYRALLRPPGAERASSEPALALQAYLADGGWRLPRRGWKVLVERDTEVLFGLRGPVRWSDTPEVVTVYVHRGDGGEWLVARVSSCDAPLRTRHGTFAHPWRLQPGRKLSRRTRVLRLRVSELFCSNGASPAGRIEEPLILYGRRYVRIAIFVRPVFGGGNCQSSPEARYTLRLAEPLGDRRLLNAGTVPASCPLGSGVALLPKPPGPRQSRPACSAPDAAVG